MSCHGNRNQTQGNNQFQNNQQQRQGFATQQQMLLPPPPPNYQGVYGGQGNQGPPSSVSIQSGQSYSNDQVQGGGRWSQVWIPN